MDDRHAVPCVRRGDFVAGRVIHAYGVSQEHENFRLRMAGMATTLTVLAVMAVWLLMGAIGLSWP